MRACFVVYKEDNVSRCYLIIASLVLRVVKCINDAGFRLSLLKDVSYCLSMTITFIRISNLVIFRALK